MTGTNKNILTNIELSEILAEVAYTFNAISSDFFDISMDNVLSILGMHLNVSRVYIFENNVQKGANFCTFQWVNENIEAVENSNNFSDRMQFEQWDSQILEKGQIVSNNIEETFSGDFLKILKKQEIKSILAFPLYIKGKYFGFLGFDECVEYRNWQDRDVSFLRTVSHLIVDAYIRRLNEEDLKSNEEKYRNLFENARDANIILDKLNFVEFNKASLTLFNKTKHELKQQDFISLSPEKQLNNEDTEALAFKYIKAALKGEKQFFPWLFTKNDKSIFETEVSLSRFKKGNTFFLLAVIRDISKNKKHEKKINEQMIKLEEVNRTKDRFFSIIAHDLKNPFNSLIGITENLLESLDDFSSDEIKEYLSLLLQSSQQGYNLLENLLHWSRSQTGKLTVSPKVINLNELTETTINLMLHNISEKKLEVVNNIDFNTLAYADENMITTILRNLLSNAIKFTPKGGNITIQSIKDSKQITVSVKDTGLGIDDSILSNLFKLDIFNSTLGTNQETGTGLGIILCKEFIERNNGQIWVDSKINQGTTFFFNLPRA